MVVTAADGNRVFLCAAQAGNGFSGVENFDVGAGDDVGKCTTLSGSAAQQLQEIKGGALPSDEHASFTAQRHQFCIGGYCIAVCYMPFDLDGVVQLRKNFVKPGNPADHAVFPSDDGGGVVFILGEEFGGDIAGSYVFA